MQTWECPERPTHSPNQVRFQPLVLSREPSKLISIHGTQSAQYHGFMHYAWIMLIPNPATQIKRKWKASQRKAEDKKAAWVWYEIHACCEFIIWLRSTDENEATHKPHARNICLYRMAFTETLNSDQLKATHSFYCLIFAPYRHIISLEMKLALGMRVFSVSGECVLFELAVPLQLSSVNNLKARSLAVWLANPTFSFSVYESSYLIHDSRYQIHRMCWSIKGIRFELQLSSKAFTIYSSVQKGVYIKYVSIFIYFSENVVVVLFVVDIKTDGPSHWNGYFVSIISGIQYLCLGK